LNNGRTGHGLEAHLAVGGDVNNHFHFGVFGKTAEHLPNPCGWSSEVT
jgi:hypothetical protein